jgi:signal transduction histidine kinase
LQGEALRMQTLAMDMMARERNLLALRQKTLEQSNMVLFVVLGVAAILLVVVGAGSLFVIRRYTTALTASQQRLQDLNSNLEDAVRVRTIDLQRANEEIQRFAYIVSHDLRSPLVNVMGFTAEVESTIRPLTDMLEKLETADPGLVSADVRAAISEDLPEAIGFIRTSTQKMDRLINAILRLSREGRRTLSPEAVDLALLAQGVIDGLRHRIDELGIAVRILPGMPTIIADRLAIEQIVSNLVENAVKYLQPGRPGLIEISGQMARGRATVAIRDNGRGIEARDHERIFDLFRRSGEQDQPGEGIGLAHVRALAYRLGGTISVASQLGQGATFTINVPVIAGDRGNAE